MAPTLDCQKNPSAAVAAVTNIFARYAAGPDGLFHPSVGSAANNNSGGNNPLATGDPNDDDDDDDLGGQPPGGPPDLASDYSVESGLGALSFGGGNQFGGQTQHDGPTPGSNYASDMKTFIVPASQGGGAGQPRLPSIVSHPPMPDVCLVKSELGDNDGGGGGGGIGERGRGASNPEIKQNNGDGGIREHQGTPLMVRVSRQIISSPTCTYANPGGALSVHTNQRFHFFPGY